MRSRYRRQVFTDPQERALQRRLFLERQVVTQPMLEDLIERVENGSSEEEAVDGEISGYLDQLIDEFAPPHQIFSPQLRDALVFTIYDSIQSYKDVPFRKIGGRYFRHPALLFSILLAAGCDDFETLATALDHDVPEERLKLARKRGDHRPEEEIICEILSDLRSTRYDALRKAGYNSQKARSMSDSCCSQINFVTKRDGQLYYEYVGEIFAFSHPKLTRSKQIRCMRTKYADGTANLQDLCSPQAALLRHDDITDDTVVEVIGSGDRRAVDLLVQKTRYLGQSEHHPDTAAEEMKGSDWMKLLYKATTVRQAERLWALHYGSRDPVIAQIPLSEVIVDTAQEVINHLCTYHCGGSEGQLTPQKVYTIHKEHLDYKARGGYGGVTPVGDHPFDGLLSRFFDTSVRGDSSYIKSLNDDRTMMLRAAFAFRELGLCFHDDPTFYLKGLSETGLKVVQPALV